MKQPHPAVRIVVDVGNGFVKLGVDTREPARDTPAPVRVLRFDAGEDIDRILAGLPAEAARWYVTSVARKTERRLADWVALRRPGDSYRRLQHADIPLTIQLDAPQRVGMDRLAAAVAADQMRAPQRPGIVVDAGSAVTVDVVSADGRFLGGAILPGITMGAGALARETDQLPTVDVSAGQGQPAVIGKSTQEAIRSGLIWGTVGAVRELVRRMARELDERPQLFLTGGHCDCLREIDDEITVEPNLVLIGIALTARHLAQVESP